MIATSLAAFQIYNPLLPNKKFDPEEAPALLGQTLSTILTLLLIGAGVAFFFMLTSGGIRWIISGGDKEKIEGAKKQITSATLGLVIILSVFAVTSLIEILFGVSLVSFNLPRLIAPAP
jgi:hypothetical protein